MVYKNTVLRITRTTNYLELIINVYKNGLGLEELGLFKDHKGFYGTILGHKNCTYHFEFTTPRGSIVFNNTNEDNLIVFYINNNVEWESSIHKMTTAGFKNVKSFNPFWDNSGRTFEDPEGY